MKILVCQVKTDSLLVNLSDLQKNARKVLFLGYFFGHYSDSNCIVWTNVIKICIPDALVYIHLLNSRYWIMELNKLNKRMDFEYVYFIKSLIQTNEQGNKGGASEARWRAVEKTWEPIQTKIDYRSNE